MNFLYVLSKVLNSREDYRLARRYDTRQLNIIPSVSVRMNHAVADGYLVARVFVLLEQEIEALCKCVAVCPYIT